MASFLGHSPYHHRALTPAPRDYRSSFNSNEAFLLRTEPDAHHLKRKSSIRWRVVFARMLFAVLFLGVLALLGYEGYTLYQTGRLWPLHL